MYPGLYDEWQQMVNSSATQEIAATIGQLDPIDLEELGNVRLLDRIDTKFVLHDWQLLDILQEVGERYRVLHVTSSRINHYRTLYFDTADLWLYRQHHSGIYPRYKVRCREYVDTGVHFLEVKCKTNRRRTVKQRMETPAMFTQLRDAAHTFVKSHCPVEPDLLMPCILNECGRITLVNREMTERLTIDINYRHMWRNRDGGLPGLVIAEVKQPKFTSSSAFVGALRAHKIRAVKFSKYCTGIVDLYPHVKHNRFKPRIMLLQRLNR